MRQPLDNLLDTLRAQTGDLGNHAIDEFSANRLTRRELMRVASTLGFASLFCRTGSLLARDGVASSSPNAPSNATIRIAQILPPGAIDPLTIVDGASVSLVNQCAEYLVNDGEHQILSPALAESWSSNEACDVWTFKLRRNVKFHDGQPMTSKDVVATFDRLTDPSRGSAAVSVFRGILRTGATRAVDDYTVAFHLDSPNASFPYFVSSDTYNAVILPATYDGGYEKTFAGTGPFRIESYVPKISAIFVRNEDYWGAKALPARLEFRFYADGPARILAARSGQVDVIPSLAIQNTLDFMHNPGFRIQSVAASSHRQMHMRTDAGPFKDKRVRQALALCIDRDILARGLMRGRAVVGNDSPFAPIFPVTDATVPQRKQDLPMARQLMAQAGVPNGFPVTLTVEKYMEVPDYAVIVQNAAKRIGIDITLKMESREIYYGSAKPGQSDWLDSPFGLTIYGHRGIPNVLLGPPLLSGGKWNAARFSNPAYDKLYTEFVGALAIADQKRVAGQIGRLLLDETPMVIGFFYDALAATSTRLQGVTFTPIGQLYLDRARFI
ncbi:extracellular solute-binding protein [Pandoraea iniqua]|uniref:Extracellular solute-binding protein n=1 Tax=Pandoraea iniqua TaxID=2508288 RepID=A0A5E4VWQ1_9BURK|nr:ABC transporter substrate-binding protein [Pandoraea iniqua]VVE15460.1 extracellular solute-binding protein [Pandoraea iniqua]